MPQLQGRTAIVTGASSGIGLVTAAALARHGATVTMAVRNTEKGEQVRTSLAARGLGEGSLEVRELDLASLASIRGFCASWSSEYPEGLDLLINNAGVMALPLMTTADGFEMQLGTNHLGHFALTAQLLPALVARPSSRVVTVSSQAHRFGRINFDDLMGERGYRSWPAYGQSKLANLLFTSELQRRLDLHGISTLSMAAHPGLAATSLPGQASRAKGSARGAWIAEATTRVFAQSSEMGALPTLFAATVGGLPGDTYVGPAGFLEQRGHPKVVDRAAQAKDVGDARRLWAMSEELTGVSFGL